MSAAVKRIGELTEKQPGETGLVDTNDISTGTDTIKIKIQGKYPDEIYVKGFERASDNIDDADRPLFSGLCSSLSDICETSKISDVKKADGYVVTLHLQDNDLAKTVAVQVMNATFLEQDHEVGIGAYSVGWVLNIDRS